MRTLFFVAVTSWASSAAATTIDVGDVDALKTAISNAEQGDEIVVAGGTYVLTAPLVIVGHGTAEAPIFVHGADGQTAVISQSGSGDIFTLQSTSYVKLQSLVLTGGGRALHLVASDNITVANLVIYDIGLSAIAANDGTAGHNYVGLLVFGNDIYNFGTAVSGQAAVSLGCASLACSVTGPLVASNYIHGNAQNPVGQGDGILMQPGVSGADVRDNVVTGLAGRGIAALDAHDLSRNTIERNAVWDTSSVGIDASGDATIRNNIIIGTGTAGLRVAPAPGAVTNLTITNNTILVTDTALTVTSPQNAVVIADNALFGATALQIVTPGVAPTITANVGSGGLDGVASGVSNGASIAATFLNAKADATALNVYPKVGSPLIGTGDSATEATDDFNGTTRGSSVDVGAYAYASTGNPGQPLAAGFKTLAPGGGDSDSGGGDGTTSPVGSAGGGGGGENIPIPSNNNTQGCAAAAGSWAISLVVAVWVLGRRKAR